MKHPVAVAILSGFTDALAEEVNNGNMAERTAKQVAQFAMAISQEYLKGASVFGQKLEEFHETGEQIESLLRSNKVNLQRFGDV
jgi:hypothetical protein